LQGISISADAEGPSIIESEIKGTAIERSRLKRTSAVAVKNGYQLGGPNRREKPLEMERGNNQGGERVP